MTLRYILFGVNLCHCHLSLSCLVFQPFHTPVTCMFEVINDLFTLAPSGILNVLILLDLSAAFHTVCRSNLWTELCRHHTGLDYFFICQTVHISSLRLAPALQSPLLHKRGSSRLSSWSTDFFVIYIRPLRYVRVWLVYWKLTNIFIQFSRRKYFLLDKNEHTLKRNPCNPWDWWHVYFSLCKPISVILHSKNLHLFISGTLQSSVCCTLLLHPSSLSLSLAAWITIIQWYQSLKILALHFSPCTQLLKFHLTTFIISRRKKKHIRICLVSYRAFNLTHRDVPP